MNSLASIGLQQSFINFSIWQRSIGDTAEDALGSTRISSCLHSVAKLMVGRISHRANTAAFFFFFFCLLVQWHESPKWPGDRLNLQVQLTYFFVFLSGSMHPY